MNKRRSPDEPLVCLLIQPEFLESNFWNFKISAKAIGAQAIAPPLGLLTVAALLPQHWKIKLVDLNVRRLDDREWNEADVICTGGMLPQQAGILEIVQRANQDSKYVIVGGPDPTSQPELYGFADARVLGEGEASIPIWLESWRNGKPSGTFESKDTPDVTLTPIPRFDLVRKDDYLHFGLQSSRGCPYNCEFCDIIELFGRKPRVKNPDQFIREVQALYDYGYRGWVDIADDNFIGNRHKTKETLTALVAWQAKHNYPFVFSTEASVNLADDEDLLSLMTVAQFHYVFLGIETPDQRVLSQTQKKINTVRPLIDRVNRIYQAGISVTAGFILGFDSEPEDCDQALIDFIQESGVMLATVSLLTALPNTQLTRRLARERRLISPSLDWIVEPTERYNLVSSSSFDQTIGGLNFVTVRDRREVYRQLLHVVETIYSPKAFMERVLDTTKRLNLQSKHRLSLWELKRLARGFVVLATKLFLNRRTRWHFIQNFWKTMWLGPAKFLFANQLMGTYLHFFQQTEKMREVVANSIRYAETEARFPRNVAEAEARLRQINIPQSSILAIAKTKLRKSFRRSNPRRLIEVKALPPGP